MSDASHQTGLARLARGHALGWLVLANAAGVWLAALLVWPALGAGAVGSYGRWMPAHLNGQLYGWCALPLVAALLAACLDPRHPAALGHARFALGAWSAGLAAGTAAWLGGVTSGKLFLDWAGWARPALAMAMAALWTVLAAHLWWRRDRSGDPQWRVAAGLVLVLAAVPSLLYWSAGRDVYPAVNPHSGGATGASLLGSTLGILAVFGVTPWLLGLARREGRSTGWFWWSLAGSFLVFATLKHGHASHHEAGQIAGLGVLLAWIPLLWRYGAAWAWSRHGRRWAVAAGAWWAVLVVSGWVTFLPGYSEAWKFTHVLVAHAHLAMAGLVTSVNFLVLTELAPERPFAGRGVFWTWQTAAAAHVALVFGLGVREAGSAADLFYGLGPGRWVFLARLAVGALMLGASAAAWVNAVRRQPSPA